MIVYEHMARGRFNLDYLNAYYGKALKLKVCDEQAMVSSFRERPIPHYNIFSGIPKSCEGLQRWRRLNEVADIANERFSEPGFDPADFYMLANEAHDLITRRGPAYDIRGNIIIGALETSTDAA